MSSTDHKFYGDIADECAALVEAMAGGKTYTAAFSQLGVDPALTEVWASRNTEWQRARAIGNTLRQHFWERRLASGDNANIMAAKFALEHTCPADWGDQSRAAFKFELPDTSSPKGLASASLHILGAVAEGKLTAWQASLLTPLIEAARRALETSDLAERLEKLEAAHAGSVPPPIKDSDPIPFTIGLPQ